MKRSRILARVPSFGNAAVKFSGRVLQFNHNLRGFLIRSNPQVPGSPILYLSPELNEAVHHICVPDLLPWECGAGIWASHQFGKSDLA
jgi:hypothetical protein